MKLSSFALFLLFLAFQPAFAEETAESERATSSAVARAFGSILAKIPMASRLATMTHRVKIEIRFVIIKFLVLLVFRFGSRLETKRYHACLDVSGIGFQHVVSIHRLKAL